MRRLAPRPLGEALRQTTGALAPAGALARVQACWPDVAGPVVAAETEPVSERGGVVTVRCSSSVWAQELELLSPDLLARLREALGGTSGSAPVERLKFVSGGRPRGA